MDSKSIVLAPSRFGKGVFATSRILKDEHIAAFDGPIYDIFYQNWTVELSDHVIQFGRCKWRDSSGMARFINHSCDPNAGIRGLFDLVAMRTIEAGEEIFFDYEMAENGDGWQMQCKCGSRLCRGVIGAFDNMPQTTRARYAGYISSWLTEEYDHPAYFAIRALRRIRSKMRRGFSE